jgi:hypothetical protein
MTLHAGTPATGAIYQASVALTAGSHEYFFVFNDGQSAVAAPWGPRTLVGPTVT